MALSIVNPHFEGQNYPLLSSNSKANLYVAYLLVSILLAGYVLIGDGPWQTVPAFIGGVPFVYAVCQSAYQYYQRRRRINEQILQIPLPRFNMRGSILNFFKGAALFLIRQAAATPRTTKNNLPLAEEDFEFRRASPVPSRRICNANSSDQNPPIAAFHCPAFMPQARAPSAPFISPALPADVLNYLQAEDARRFAPFQYVTDADMASLFLNPY